MASVVLVCSACGYQAHQWMGRCPECGSWDSLESPHQNAEASAPIPISEIDPSARVRFPTGLKELDRVLGGGLVPGSVVLLSGEPGVGKSTLVLQAAAGIEGSGKKVLIVCGEESLDQVAARAVRIGGLKTSLLSAQTDVAILAGYLREVDVAFVDSIQTIKDLSAPGEAGSVAQVKASASALARVARSSGTAIFLVGHVTKEGAVAGPRTLEHVVDAVCSFEGDLSASLRTIRAAKNRFGSTGEIGVFEMTGEGLVEVSDASRMFLSDRIEGAPGSAVSCIVEGRRALAVEVQALCLRGSSASRRVANGIDTSRLGLIAAVVHKHGGVSLEGFDVYASIAGGVRTGDPGADLGLALAIVGSRLEKPLPRDFVAVGEVGLTGEIRRVAGMESRLAEAERLGFRTAVVPRSFEGCCGMDVLAFKDIASALNVIN